VRRITGLIATIAVAGAALTPAVAAQPAKHYNVFEYSIGPHKLTINRGTRVTWTWTGLKMHSVTVASGPASFSSRIQTHGSYGHMFTRRGAYHLYCQVHPDTMRMTVVVR
jgi:plastocyanin